MRRATVNLPVPIIFASLQNRNIDVFLGNWMPAQEADSKPYLANHSVEVVGANLEKAKFTLAVPQYLYDSGLKDFASIQKFAGPLDSQQIYGIEPGAAANRLVLGMIRANAFGLGHFRLIESSASRACSPSSSGRIARTGNRSCSWRGIRTR